MWLLQAEHRKSQLAAAQVEGLTLHPDFIGQCSAMWLSVRLQDTQALPLMPILTAAAVVP